VSRRFRVATTVVVTFLALATFAFVAWTREARYEATPEAAAVAAAAERRDGWYVFHPPEASDVGVIFYPGGLVDPEAYAPWLRSVADHGVLAVLIPMPLDLAVFGIDRAAAVPAAFPAIRRWAIAGHSLGGAMAASYARRHPERLTALALLASFPPASTDLSDSGLATLSIVGDRNGGSPLDTFRASLERLPTATEFVIIPGGNHAQFGHYGPQAGDGEATIDRLDQQAITTAALIALLEP
jgi:poly(3-hydroxybutyrate) depolymerase